MEEQTAGSGVSDILGPRFQERNHEGSKTNSPTEHHPGRLRVQYRNQASQGQKCVYVCALKNPMELEPGSGLRMRICT